MAILPYILKYKKINLFIYSIVLTQNNELPLNVLSKHSPFEPRWLHNPISYNTVHNTKIKYKYRN